MWLEVDEDLPEHPKSLRLCAKLMNPLAWAYVIKLWRWCCKFAPDGDLTDFGADEIEIGLGWTLDAGVLFAALKTAGFVEDTADGRIVVHDWMEHQGRALKKMEKDRKRKAKSRSSRPRDVPRTSTGRPRSVRVTAPVPNLTKPNLTKQDQEPEISAETASPSSTPAPGEKPVLTFPCDGEPKAWSLLASQVARWSELFPSLDVMAQCRGALAYVEAAPARRKTAAGMERFLVAWFSRTQNGGGHARASPSVNGHRDVRIGHVPAEVKERPSGKVQL